MMTTKTLKVTYTFEELQESDEYIFIAEELSKAITEEIDWEIISELLISTGWIRVQLDYRGNPADRLSKQQDIISWITENIRGSSKSHGFDWLFKDEKDAALFALRWV